MLLWYNEKSREKKTPYQKAPSFAFVLRLYRSKTNICQINFDTVTDTLGKRLRNIKTKIYLFVCVLKLRFLKILRNSKENDYDTVNSPDQAQTHN